MEILAFLVMFLILIVYLRKTNALSAKVSELEREMHGLRHAVSSSTPAAMPPPLTATPESKVESAIPPSRVAPTPLISSKPLFSPSHTRAEWEALIGGKLLNRIGALALIIGIGFFLKYAFDRNWISETIRVLIGFLVGAGLLAGGSRTHKKGFQIFAQGINGAGIAILYLSVYASFNFYHLVSQPVAFIMMSTVTALTFLQALKYDSLAVSLLGWAGGFLTPFMLNTGQSNEVGLFSYIVLLDIGLLAILLKKDLWIILEPFTLAATYLIYFFWYDEYYTDDKLLVTVLFLTIFWGLFYALDLHRIVKSSQRFGQVRQADAVFNAVFYYAAMYAIINPSHHQWMSIVTLIIGAVYFLTGLALKERRMEARAALARYTLTAIVLLIFATEIQFTGFKTAIFWSLEALILLWCGIHWKLRYVWQAGLGLMGLALLRLLGTEGALAYSPIENFRLILNLRVLAFSVLVGTLGASAVFFRQVDAKSSEMIRSLLHGASSVLLFILLTVEGNDYFRHHMLGATEEMTTSMAYHRFMTWPAIWTFYSLPLVWLGLRRKILPILYCGLGSLGLAILMIAIQGFSFCPIAQFTPVLNWRAAVFVLVIAGCVVQARWLSANRQHAWTSEVPSILQVVVVLLLLDLFTGETGDIFKKAIFFAQQSSASSEVSGEISRLQNLRQLTLSGVWLFYSVFLMVAGIWRRSQGLRIMAIVLFGVTILKIFIYDLSFLERLYRIFSFVGLGVILLAVSYLYQRYKAVIFDSAK